MVEAGRAAPPEDTIAALATPLGPSSCAVLRLSGPQALAAAARVLRGADSRQGPLERWPPFTLAPAVLLGAAGPAAARAMVFRAPRSYTREDMVEVTLPGCPPLLAAVLAGLLALESPPVRLARPGEFTLRAFLSGRIDLSQAEAVASLIEATSEAEGRAAARQLRGELGSRVEEAARALVEALALIEAGLDFPDEDLPQVAPAALAAALAPALRALEALRASSSLRLPDRGALRAVLAGFPNAGKSSLLNALLGRPAAIVAAAAGTTRDPVRGQSSGPRGRPIEWIDLAGFEAPPIEAEAGGGAGRGGAMGIEEAVLRLTRRELESADVLVWVVDGSLPDAAERSLALLARLAAPRRVLALSKADLLGAAEIEGWRSRLEGVVVISALRGQGLAELVERVGRGPETSEAPQFLLTARQEAALERAAALARGAGQALERGEGAELAAVDLREALGALGEITGREVGERVLEAVFSRFCIGK